jgi:hypothetical protein
MTPSDKASTLGRPVAEPADDSAAEPGAGGGIGGPGGVLVVGEELALASGGGAVAGKVATVPTGPAGAARSSAKPAAAALPAIKLLVKKSDAAELSLLVTIQAFRPT